MEKKNINAEQSKKQEDNGGKMMQEDNSTSTPNQISNSNPPLCPLSPLIFPRNFEVSSLFHGSLNNNQFNNTILSNIVTVDPYHNPADWCNYTYPRDQNLRTPFRDCTGTGFFLPTSSKMTQNPVRQSGSQTNNNKKSIAFRPLMIRPSTSQQGSGSSDGIKRSVNIECSQVSSRRSLSTAESSVCHDDIHSFPDNTETNKLDEKPLDVGQSCKICNEDILGQETRVFPCQHAFHIKCLQFLTHPQAHSIQPHCPHCPFCLEFPIKIDLS